MSAPHRQLLCWPVVALVCAVSGCSYSDGPGARPVPSPSPRAAALCRTLHDRLPKTVEGQHQNPGGPHADYAADWGDPSIRLRCGVRRPALLTPGTEHYNPTAQAFEVNGVSWLPERQDDGYRFTTTGRKAYVEVSVPDRYAPEVNPLTDLASAVKRSVPTEL